MLHSFNLSKPRLLLVDDEPINLNILSRIFSGTCEIDTAANGRIALEKFANNTYDVILLDIMMPDVDGLEVLKTIRETTDIMELPIVLISAISDKHAVTHGIRLGANDYITKPIDIDIVQARVGTQIAVKQLVNERKRLVAQLQTANDMKMRMMQVASHDLKNPINNLQILASLMHKDHDHDPKTKRFLQMTDESVSTMLHVVEDFLDSSINQDGLNVAISPVESYPIIESVVNQYAVAASEKSITFETEHAGGIVLADQKRLMQVIGNLVSNAVKYSPRGSTVRIMTETTDAHRWRLKVIDQGGGIPPDEFEHLFKPFSKDKISTKPTAGESSTGLGLWIVYEMVRLQDGRVGAENLSEGGCCFWIELPLTETIAHP